MHHQILKLIDNNIFLKKCYGDTRSYMQVLGTVSGLLKLFIKLDSIIINRF